MLFPFFLYNWLIIPAVIVQVFILIAELAIPTRTHTNDVNAEIEMQAVTVETKIRKCSSLFKYLHGFL